MAGDGDLVDGAGRLLEGHHGRRPVVAGRRLAGCVDRRELVRALHPDAEGPP